MPEYIDPDPHELGHGRVWRTGSKTRPGVAHITIRSDDGKWQCFCEGFLYHLHCRHVDQLMDELGDVDEDFHVSM